MAPVRGARNSDTPARGAAKFLTAGRAVRKVREVLALGPGSIVELNKLAGEPVDLLVNGKPIAKAEVVVIDENFGVRLTQISHAAERLQSLS